MMVITPRLKMSWQCSKPQENMGNIKKRTAVKNEIVEINNGRIN